MRRRLVVLLLVCLLLTGVALAAGADGRGSMVARNGELSAFTDGAGNIYISGQQQGVNKTPAARILSIDAYRILFFAQKGNLVAIDLNDNFKESVCSTDAYAACVDGDNIFYISGSNRCQLCRYDLSTGKRTKVCKTAEELGGLYMTRDGLVVTMDGDCAYIYDELRKKLVSYGGNIATEIVSDSDCDISFTEDQELYISDKDDQSELIDSDVRDWCVMGDRVYYLSGYGKNLMLKSFDTVNHLRSVVLNTVGDMQPRLTASQSKLFMLSEDNEVFTVDPQRRRMDSYVTLVPMSSYKLGGEKKVESYRLEAVSGQLNLYGVVGSAKTDLPTFSFVTTAIDSSNASASSDGEQRLLSAYVIQDEANVLELLRPAERYSPLRKGSRGKAVSDIQKPLLKLGYYDYNIDGIFGWRTEAAVRMLQEDLDLPVTGVADEELQRLLLSGKLAPYDPYRGLSRGMRGRRVREMQQRLRDLGYLADSADGVFGPRTEKAVALFQRENGFRSTGIADSKTLERLMSGRVESCSSYIDLYRGDSGYRVRELNRRLKELYYLDGEVSSSYGSATEQAVRLFQKQVGMRVTGSATVDVQQKLFLRSAPEYRGYITLRRGDDNARVRNLKSRLKELNYYNGKVNSYFDRETRDAVLLFQRYNGLKASGIATVEMQERLFDRHAPYYDPHEKIGTPQIELSAYTSFKDGLYTIADSDTDSEGNVRVDWFTKGDVKFHSLKIEDDRGNVYLDIDEAPVGEDSVNIPLLVLDAKRTYTFTVKAVPVDTKRDKARSASIRFIRKEGEPDPDPKKKGEISDLMIQPASESFEYKDGIYIFDGDSFAFEWYAMPVTEVRGYAFDVGEPTGSPIIVDMSISDRQILDLTTEQFEASKIYALTVYAVPVNGEISDAVNATVSFKLKGEEPVIVDEPVIDGMPAPVLDQAPVLMMTGSAESFSGRFEGEPVEVSRPEGEEVGVEWTAPDEADSFKLKLTDENGNVYLDSVVEDTGTTLRTAALTEGRVYRMTVTAMAATGASADSEPVYIGIPEATEEVIDDVTGETEDDAAPAEEEPVEYPVGDFDDLPDIDDESAGEEPVEEPTIEEEVFEEQPVEEEVYEEQPVEEEAFEEQPVEEEAYEEQPVEEEAYEEQPAEEETTEEPTVEEETVAEPVPGMSPADGSFYAAFGGEDVTVLVPQGDTVSFSWGVEGAVSYRVRIYDDQGVTYIDNELSASEQKLATNNLMVGRIYCLDVTAIGANGSQADSQPLYFGYPAEKTQEEIREEREEEATEEPAYDEPEEDFEDEEAYEEPVREEPDEDFEEEKTYEEPVREEPEEDFEEEETYEEPAREEPEEDFEEEETYEEPAREEPDEDFEEEETYEEPAREEPEDDFEEEEAYEEPVREEPEYDDTEENGADAAISRNSGRESIMYLQYSLIERGYLSEDECAIGTLDDATVAAVIRFQQENGLKTCDPGNPVIDAGTLDMLF